MAFGGFEARILNTRHENVRAYTPPPPPPPPPEPPPPPPPEPVGETYTPSAYSSPPPEPFLEVPPIPAPDPNGISTLEMLAGRVDARPAPPSELDMLAGRLDARSPLPLEDPPPPPPPELIEVDKTSTGATVMSAGVNGPLLMF
ncbi:MAG: hypothetical protein AB7S38_27465 [Vulcanimicrobiota bacterium]